MFFPRMFNRKQLTVALGLMLVLVLVSALPGFAAPLVQEEGLGVGEILANPAQYEEQSVLVNGEIVNLDISPNVAVLGAEDALGLDRIVVLGAQEMFQDLEEGVRAEVTGTVRTFEEGLQQELDFAIDEQTASTLIGRPVIVAQDIQTVAAAAPNENVVIQAGDRTITQEQFDQQFMDLVRTIAARQGIPLNQETIQLFEGLRTQYLQQLAAEETLLAEAEARGITVTDEELQTQIDQISERFADEEAFQAALEQAGFADEAELREFIRRNEILSRAGEAIRGEIEVADEEAQQFYDENPQLFETEEGVTPFEDVEEPIRQQLEQQQFRQEIADLQEEEGIMVFRENLQPFEGFEDMELEEAEE